MAFDKVLIFAALWTQSFTFIPVFLSSNLLKSSPTP